MSDISINYTISGGQRTRYEVEFDSGELDYAVYLNSQFITEGRVETSGVYGGWLPTNSAENELLVVVNPDATITGTDVNTTLRVFHYDQKEVLDSTKMLPDTYIYSHKISRWVSNLCSTPDGYLNLATRLLEFKSSTPEGIDEGTSSVGGLGEGLIYWSTAQPTLPKSYKTIAINAPAPPRVTMLRTDGFYRYYADLLSEQWNYREGLHQSYFPRDMYDGGDGLTGQLIIGKETEVEMWFNHKDIDGTSISTIGYNQSHGINTL